MYLLNKYVLILKVSWDNFGQGSKILKDEHEDIYMILNLTWLIFWANKLNKL